MALFHPTCPDATDDTRSVFVQQPDGRLQCDHCGRILMPRIDLPDCVALTEPDPELDRIASLVKRTVNATTALVNLLDQERQVFFGTAGLDETAEREASVDASFCKLVVMSDSPLIIPDTELEPLVADQLARATLQVRAYAGFPVTDLDGQVVGALCAIDAEVHHWSDRELGLLEDFAALASAEVRNRIAVRQVQDVLGQVNRRSDAG